jgi:hypothetical protein
MKEAVKIDGEGIMVLPTMKNSENKAAGHNRGGCE